MVRPLVRALISAVLGAALAAAWLVVAFARDGVVTLEMDRELPRVVTHGFYAPERVGDDTFAWTTDRAGLRLTGVDRSVPWRCDVRFRGARADVSTLPDVAVDVDGRTVARQRATNEFAEMAVDVPPRPERPGLALTLTISNTFVPGPGDPRILGIVVDRLACAPVEASARPPRLPLLHAVAGGAAFGAAVGIAGLPLSAAAAIVLMVSAGQAALVSSGLAPYGRYSDSVLWSGLWLSAIAAALVFVLERLRRRPLSEFGLIALLFSAAVLHLKLLALLHPSKMIIDAVFHAHRLQWVLEGRYLFTQPMPGGVSFPYAIALYVFAAPWTALTNDYVNLLRIVVSSMSVVAGGLLYPLIVRTWRDPLAGVLAVVLYHCVPLPYLILGNANMTNVFGQAVALAAVVTMGLAPSRPRAWTFWIGAFAVCAVAFLSHISTFTQLVATLLVLGGLYWLFGGEELRRPGRAIVLVTIVAALAAVVVYYGHFMDVYRTAWHARTQASVAAPADAGPTGPSSLAQRSRAGGSIAGRLGSALRSSAIEFGWPILALAAIGVWRILVHGVRNRLAFTAAAFAATYFVFLLASTLSRVDAPFERYAAEFVGRVVLATFPGLVILAAIGASWGWRTNVTIRVISAVMLVAAASIGVVQWRGWFL